MSLNKMESTVYNLIRKNTDKFGWGLEMSEILDDIDFEDKHVKTAISTLIKKKTINKKQLKFNWSTSSRVFYNDTKKEQK